MTGAPSRRDRAPGPESIQIDPGGGRLVYRAGVIDLKAPATPVIPEDKTITATVQILFRTRATR